MLVKYKKDYEKIAMGFLSYLVDFKNIHNLQEEMQLYQKDNEYQIFLYRPEEGDFEGLLGVQIAPKFVLVRYESLTPGYRDQENKLRMLNELQQLFEDRKILGAPELATLIQEFEDQKNG